MQGSEQLKINHFDVLVHPYFVDCEDNLGTINTEAYQELVVAWGSRFEALVKRKDAALLYYSCLEDPENQYRQGWEDLERARVRSLQERLGARMLTFTEGLDFPKQKPLLDTLQRKGLIWDPAITTMWIYGEYMEACVKNWGESVREHLGIRRQNYQDNLPNLSMTDTRARRIYSEVVKWIT